MMFKITQGVQTRGKSSGFGDRGGKGVLKGGFAKRFDGQPSKINGNQLAK